MSPLEKEKLLERISESDYLPSLSPLAVQLIGLAADERSSILDLTRVIEQDPGLTARLLKIVNSAFYAHREPISSISYAVMVAGFNKIRLMALNISLKDTFPLGQVRGMDYDYFWKTSLYRAIIAQDLIKGSYLNGSLDHEEVFTAGLILEIGLPLCFHLCPDELQDSFPGGDAPLEEVLHWEEEHLGFNHRDLGRLTLQKWNFPEHFIDVQKNYGPQAFRDEAPPFAKIVETARVLTHLFFGEGEEDFSLLKEISGMLKISIDRLSEILSDAFFRVENLARDLRIHIDPQQDRKEVMEKAVRALTRIQSSIEENFKKLNRLVEPSLTSPPPIGGEPTVSRKKELETALEALAHEIRNPLAAIGGFAQRMLQQGPEQGEVIRYAELIAKESQRLEQAITHLLNLSGQGEKPKAS